LPDISEKVYRHQRASSNIASGNRKPDHDAKKESSGARFSGLMEDEYIYERQKFDTKKLNSLDELCSKLE
jgi:hypothetical protein